MGVPHPPPQTPTEVNGQLSSTTSILQKKKQQQQRKLCAPPPKKNPGCAPATLH